jgi:hypothetical protein
LRSRQERRFSFFGCFTLWPDSRLFNTITQNYESAAARHEVDSREAAFNAASAWRIHEKRNELPCVTELEQLEAAPGGDDLPE